MDGRTTRNKFAEMLYVGYNLDIPIIRTVSNGKNKVCSRENYISEAGEKVLTIIDTKKALFYAVKNVTVTKRNTRLKERLISGSFWKSLN